MTHISSAREAVRRARNIRFGAIDVPTAPGTRIERVAVGPGGERMEDVISGPPGPTRFEQRQEFLRAESRREKLASGRFVEVGGRVVPKPTPPPVTPTPEPAVVETRAVVTTPRASIGRPSITAGRFDPFERIDVIRAERARPRQRFIRGKPVITPEILAFERAEAVREFEAGLPAPIIEREVTRGGQVVGETITTFEVARPVSVLRPAPPARPPPEERGEFLLAGRGEQFQEAILRRPVRRLQTRIARAAPGAVPVAEIASVAALGTVLGVSEAVGGVAGLLRPGGLAAAGRGVVAVARQPRQFAGQLGGALVTQPAFTAGRIAGTLLTLRAEQALIGAGFRRVGAARARAVSPQAVGTQITARRIITPGPGGPSVAETAAFRGRFVGQTLFGRRAVDVVGTGREILAPSPVRPGVSVLRGRQTLTAQLPKGTTFTATKLTEGLARQTAAGQTATTRFTSQFFRQAGQPGLALRARETFVSAEQVRRTFTTAEGARVTIPPRTIVTTTGRIRFIGRPVRAEAALPITRQFVTAETIRPSPEIDVLRVAGRARRITQITDPSGLTIERFRGEAFGVRPGRFRFARPPPRTDVQVRALRQPPTPTGPRQPVIQPTPAPVTFPTRPVTRFTPTTITRVVTQPRIPTTTTIASLQTSAQELARFSLQEVIGRQAVVAGRAGAIGITGVTAAGISARLAGPRQLQFTRQRIEQAVTPRQITSPRLAISPRAAVTPRAALVPATALIPRVAVIPRAALAVVPRAAVVPRQAVFPRQIAVPRFAPVPRPGIVTPSIFAPAAPAAAPFALPPFIPQPPPTRPRRGVQIAAFTGFTPDFIALALGQVAPQRVTGRFSPFERRFIPTGLVRRGPAII